MHVSLFVATQFFVTHSYCGMTSLNNSELTAKSHKSSSTKQTRERERKHICIHNFSYVHVLLPYRTVPTFRDLWRLQTTITPLPTITSNTTMQSTKRLHLNYVIRYIYVSFNGLLFDDDDDDTNFDFSLNRFIPCPLVHAHSHCLSTHTHFDRQSSINQLINRNKAKINSNAHINNNCSPLSLSGLFLFHHRRSQIKVIFFCTNNIEDKQQTKNKNRFKLKKIGIFYLFVFCQDFFFLHFYFTHTI